MRYIVYGAGAIGGTIGGRLFEHGRDVVLIARGNHGRVLGERGLRLATPDGSAVHRIPVVDHPARLSFRDGDVALLTMKSQDTAAALRDLSRVAPHNLPVVCAQNGVDNERTALRHFENVHAMNVVLPATHLEPGVVLAHGAPLSGVLDVGCYPSGANEIDERIAADFEASRFSSRPTADVMRSKYRKLLTNLGNALDAACGLQARTSELYGRAKAEGTACLEACGIDVASDEEDAARRGALAGIHAVEGTPYQGSSSWQSLVRGTGTIEVDYLNGEIVLLGRMAGIPTPINAMLQRVANRMVHDGTVPGSLTLEDLERELTSHAA